MMQTALKQLATPECADLLKALGEPLRLRIIDLLRRGPMCVTDMARALDAEIVTVSHHLGILFNASLIRKQRQGRFIVYELTPQLYQPTGSPKANEYLDLGCCRIEINRAAESVPRGKRKD